jgi:hypothetical protein
MRRYLIAGALVGAFLAMNSVVRAGTVTVDAKTSVFSSAFDADGSGDDTSLPSVVIPLPAGATSITFSATGTINPAFFDHGADGGNYDNTGVDISSYGPISGIVDSDDRTFALMGVFTTPGTLATDSAPARLDFTGNHDFTSLSPLVNQSFFIGDGKTSTSVTQTFFVPAGATAVQLGFADAFFYSNIAFIGEPSSYADNNGSLSVTYNVAAVPLPGTALAGIALLAVTAIVRRKRASQC